MSLVNPRSCQLEQNSDNSERISYSLTFFTRHLVVQPNIFSMWVILISDTCCHARVHHVRLYVANRTRARTSREGRGSARAEVSAFFDVKDRVVIGPARPCFRGHCFSDYVEFTAAACYFGSACGCYLRAAARPIIRRSLARHSSSRIISSKRIPTGWARSVSTRRQPRRRIRAAAPREKRIQAALWRETPPPPPIRGRLPINSKHAA